MEYVSVGIILLANELINSHLLDQVGAINDFLKKGLAETKNPQSQ